MLFKIGIVFDIKLKFTRPPNGRRWCKRTCYEEPTVKFDWETPKIDSDSDSAISIEKIEIPTVLLVPKKPKKPDTNSAISAERTPPRKIYRNSHYYLCVTNERKNWTPDEPMNHRTDKSWRPDVMAFPSKVSRLSSVPEAGENADKDADGIASISTTEHLEHWVRHEPQAAPNEITRIRRYYNDTVLLHRNLVERFQASIVEVEIEAGAPRGLENIQWARWHQRRNEGSQNRPDRGKQWSGKHHRAPSTGITWSLRCCGWS